MQIDELKAQRVWVLFKTTGGTKTPIDGNGQPVGHSLKNRSRFMTYSEAVLAQQKLPGSVPAFLVPSGMVFVDLDHTTIDAPLTKELLARFATYAEHSTSGTGIHLYGTIDATRLPIVDGKIPGALQKNTALGLEMYVGDVAKRWAIYTGQRINHLPVTDCTDAVLETLGREMARPQTHSALNPSITTPALTAQNAGAGVVDGVDINGLIKQLGSYANGAKFTELFEHGNQHKTYGSDSEADLALLSMIAFACRKPAVIDAVFRKSALYRAKWEREDYRQASINRVLAANEFTPLDTATNTATTPAGGDGGVPFLVWDERAKKMRIVPQLLAKHIRETVPYILVRDSGKDACHIYLYKGGVYQYQAREMFEGLIKNTIAEVNEIYVEMRIIREVYGQLIADTNYIPRSRLDADEQIINFRNGIHRLGTSGITPHTPELLSTVQLPVDYPEQATPTPVFDKFLTELTSGDTGLQQLLLEYMGACLSNIKGHRFKKALFMVGAGNTGKSQLKALTERLLGKENFIGIDLKDIEARFGTGYLYQKRLAGSSDMSFMRVDELKTFKKLTGGDSIFAEYKGQQGFEYTYTGLLWFAMNQLPKFSGDDGAWVYERIMIAPCNNIIPVSKQDKHLLDKMWAERSGIIHKALTALTTAINNGYRFTEPTVVVNARAAYQVENNTVAAFNKDCLTSHFTHAKIQVTGMYRAYKQWCADNNNGYAKTAPEFKQALATLHGTTHQQMVTRNSRGTVYHSLGLTEDAEAEYGLTAGTRFS
ncbi:DNA primase [Leucobacter sp. OH2974_COT-288]|nr:DNA primase [Leucobacter sp. OH2974_COT-288]